MSHCNVTTKTKQRDAVPSHVEKCATAPSPAPSSQQRADTAR
jgi:hypothetical protein